jgi:hypothetical protein
MRGLQGRSQIIGLIVFAVCAQIARNWLVLQGIGVDASPLDATALLIGVAVIGLLPVAPASRRGGRGDPGSQTGWPRAPPPARS